MTSALLVFGGFVALYYGAEWLVRGSCALAFRFGLSPLLVGLTVVAFGTSSPELVVSVMAALGGGGDLAVGNVVGSNILNIGLILGLTAFITPLKVEPRLLKFDTPFLVAISAIFTWLFRDFRIERGEAAILLLLVVCYTLVSLWLAKRNSTPRTEDLYQDEVLTITEGSGGSFWRIALLISGGLVVLVAGSRSFVIGASDLARMLGVSEALIGLTIVSIGTSLPELASSLVAALRKQADIAVGNIVGSNIFNILAIMGVAGLVKPLHASGISMVDFVVMIVFAVAFYVMAFRDYRLHRWEGVVLLAGYTGYLAWLWPE